MRYHEQHAYTFGARCGTVVDITPSVSLQTARLLPCCHVLQVPMFSASGLRVAYLKILERRLGSQYQVEKWVRKLCKSGDFLIRT